MLRRLGLQRRIMLYVTLGLVGMFGGFSLIGMQAVDRGRQLAFEERLAIAQAVAASLGGELDHVLNDATEELGETESIAPGESVRTPQALTERAFRHLSETDDFSFVSATGLAILDGEGRLLASSPPGAIVATGDSLDDAAGTARRGPDGDVFWPDNEIAGGFMSLVARLPGPGGEQGARVVVHVRGISSLDPFVPYGRSGLSVPGAGASGGLSRRAEYRLEVLDPAGHTFLAVGLPWATGTVSPHYETLRPLMAARASEARLHRVGGGNDHVMALAPVPDSGLYLVLEQRTDVALELPNEFRRKLILFGSLGFIVTLLVAWGTTRHVVKSTEQLTAAAVRMARGQLSTAIEVDARDEIGVLAENLERMRQQLNEALEQVAITNRDLEFRVHERTRQLRELVRRVLTAQEEERRRVALELHDETAQSISALTVTLDYVLARSQGISPEETERLREARRVAADLLHGIRRLMYALRPLALEEMGLAAALRWYGEDLLDHADVSVRVAENRRGAGVPEETELVLYRIGQEALNNAARHSDAANVWIEIAYPDHRVDLTVRDDGKGFTPAEVAGDSSAQGGLGLAGMQERAALVGGTLTIDSAPGRGTVVRVEVPLDTEA